MRRGPTTINLLLDILLSTQTSLELLLLRSFASLQMGSTSSTTKAEADASVTAQCICGLPHKHSGLSSPLDLHKPSEIVSTTATSPTAVMTTAPTPVTATTAVANDAKEASKNPDIQHTLEPHQLVISGKTAANFMAGLRAMVTLSTNWGLEEQDEHVASFPTIVAKIIDGGTLKIPAKISYKVGFVICRVLHVLDRAIHLMMVYYQQPPKNFSEWKTTSDLRCRKIYASIADITNGLSALRGYADYIYHKVPMFTCTLSDAVLAGVTRTLPSVPDGLDLPPFGTSFTDSPAFAIIGDCHPQFWHTEAIDTGRHGYAGLKRNCSHF